MNKVKFSDIANFTAGQSPKSEFYTSNPINSTPFLQGNRTFGHMYPEIDTYTTKITKLAKKGEVLMSVRAPVGDLNIAPVDVCIGRGLSGICSKTGDNMFLYYALKYNTPNLVKRSNGTTFEAINKDIVNQMEMIMPSDLLTQKKVSSLLSNIDSKIENNNKIISTLESLAKTIYDYWFLQFEFPNEDGKPYKSSGGKMVWNEELKREIPEGWKCDNIASLISNEKGGDWGKESLTNNYCVNVYCIRGADFPASTGCKDMNAPERWILEKNKWKELEYGDILVEISGGSPTQSTGRVCYVNNNYLQRFNKPVITSNFCRALSLKTPDYYSWFYLMWKTLYENDLFFNYEGKTTGLKNLLFDTAVNEIKIPLPEKRILDKFVEKINPFYENIQFCCQQNKELASLRDFLLPMLMNGQVTFKEEDE